MNATLRSKENPMGPWEVAADFHVPEGFVDVSWDQDLNPSVQCEATGHTLYWDTEDRANIRAEGFEDSLRFYVITDEGDTLLETNDLEEAIQRARLPR